MIIIFLIKTKLLKSISSVDCNCRKYKCRNNTNQEKTYYKKNCMSIDF